MLEVDDDPVEARAGHDLDGLNAGNGRNRAEGGTPLPPLPAKTVEGFRYRGNQIRNSVRVAGEARRPKKLTARQDMKKQYRFRREHGRRKTASMPESACAAALR